MQGRRRAFFRTFGFRLSLIPLRVFLASAVELVRDGDDRRHEMATAVGLGCNRQHARARRYHAQPAGVAISGGLSAGRRDDLRLPAAIGAAVHFEQILAGLHFDRQRQALQVRWQGCARRTSQADRP